MNDMYVYYLEKYIEKLTNLESHLLVVYDKFGLIDDVKEIKLYLQEYEIIFVEENVVFRSLYQDIKERKDKSYILVLKDELIQNKILDFIKRSEEGKVKEITMQDLLECVEEDLKWNEKINEFNSDDIKHKFKELVYYRKLIRKSSIDKNEINKIVLSSLLELDAVKIKDEIDCYLFYRDIKDIYGEIENTKVKINVKQLTQDVFFEYGSIISKVIELNAFEEFEHLLWICCGLDSFGKLSEQNVNYVLGSNYVKLTSLYSHLDKLVNFAYLIGKKDKKYYIQKKDWSEKLILKSNIDVISSYNNYKEILREGKGSLINILESIKVALKDYNMEGLKKVYKYNLDNLYELSVLINESVDYKTTNVKELINLYDLIVNLFKKVEYAEKQIKFINNLNNYSDWELFYKNHIFDLQFLLSKLKYFDNQNIIEVSRYELVDKRINDILNKYRQSFSYFIKANYNNWIESPYSITRPILNSDISSILNLNSNKTYIFIFDGMRYDAWEYIVKPYFAKCFLNRNTKCKNSFALLPSITSISRNAIYSSIFEEYKEDTVYLTKTESIQNKNKVKEIISQDKKINIFVFNMFDKDGHKATEDFYVFYDKQNKVFERSIKEILSMITEDSNIIIASDHGLMRIDEYFNMKNEADIIDVKSRYIKTHSKIELDGFINVNNSTMLSYDNKGYFTGGGERDLYSHGGASIEEIIIPFIIFESKMLMNEKNSVNVVESEIVKFHDNKKIILSFKLNEKEKIILKALYGFKNQNISNRDIEKILISKVGSAGMVNAMIRRLIKKLKKDNFDIIEETAVGDLIMYKFKHYILEGDN